MSADSSAHRRSRIVRADAMHLPFADESIDLVVTSPPYWALRAYQDSGYLHGQIGDEDSMSTYLDRLWSVMQECWRVLSPWGLACVVIGDSRSGSGGAGGDYGHNGLRAGQPGWKGTGRRGSAGKLGLPRRRSLCGVPWRFALGCLDGYADPEGIGWVLASEVIWDKKESGMPESVDDRPRQNHETIFVLAKNPDWYGDAHAARSGRIVSDVLGVLPRSLSQPDFLVIEHDGTINGLKDPPGFVPSWAGGSEGSPAMREIIEDARARAASNRPQARVEAVRHYAAFPADLASTLIETFAPRAVCLSCNEPRRRVLGTTCGTCGAFVRRYVDRCGSCGAESQSANGKAGTQRTTTSVTTCGCERPDGPTRKGRVLDPMCGSGTVPAVADALGREGYGSDLSERYCLLSSWRQQVGVDARPVVAHNNPVLQLSLF